MAPPGGLVPPSIASIPATLGSVSGDSIAVELARTLLTLGIADPRDWAASGRTANAFVDATFARLFARHGGKDIERVFALGGRIGLEVDEYHRHRDVVDRPDGDHLCYLTIYPHSAAYVQLGPTLDALEAFQPRLGATFYHALMHALWRLGRPFGYADACDYRDMVIDSVDPDELAEYEIPDPSSSRRPAYTGAPYRDTASITRAFGGHRAIHERRWVDAALALKRRADALPKLCPDDCYDRFAIDGEPIPFVLLVNTQGDSIDACFDAQADGWAQCDGPPMVLAEFRATDHQAVATVVRTYTDYLDVLRDASALLQMLPGNTYQPVDQRSRRRQAENTSHGQVYG